MLTAIASLALVFTAIAPLQSSSSHITTKVALVSIVTITVKHLDDTRTSRYRHRKPSRLLTSNHRVKPSLSLRELLP